MTSPLLAVFVDASEKERTRYRIEMHPDGATHEVLDDLCSFGSTSTRVAAERFIAERATLAGMRALLKVHDDGGAVSGASAVFLQQLIGDDE